MLLGLLGSDFHSKNIYYGRYNVFTHNLVFYVGLGRQEWMDGVGSDDDFPIRQVLLVGAWFCFWPRWPQVFTAKKYVL